MDLSPSHTKIPDGDPCCDDAYLAASDGFAPRGMEDPSKDPQWTAVTHSAVAVRILSHDRVVHIRLTRDLNEMSDDGWARLGPSLVLADFMLEVPAATSAGYDA